MSNNSSENKSKKISELLSENNFIDSQINKKYISNALDKDEKQSKKILTNQHLYLVLQIWKIEFMKIILVV